MTIETNRDPCRIGFPEIPGNPQYLLPVERGSHSVRRCHSENCTPERQGIDSIRLLNYGNDSRLSIPSCRAATASLHRIRLCKIICTALLLFIRFLEKESPGPYVDFVAEMPFSEPDLCHSVDGQFSVSVVDVRSCSWLADW